MILQSLVRCYEILAQAGRLPKPGYCFANISFALNLSETGELLGIVSMKKPAERGKKTVDVPQSREVPELVTRSVDISPNFLCDNSTYLLGIDGKGKPERTLNCFAASRDLHQKILSGVDSAAARAVFRFFETWNPRNAAGHPAVKEHLEGLLGGGNLIFLINGETYAHEDPEVRHAWEAYRAGWEKAERMPCLVTGRDEPVAVLHGKIKGVRGAQSAGANLVSFNANAYESYGRDGGQGRNAPVSEYAAFAYVTVLNWLLANSEHRQQFGDTTVVYWAESALPVYCNMFTAMVNPQDESDNKLLHAVMTRLAQGKPVDETAEMSTPFYILGLAPNAARISVRFFLKNSFGFFLENLTKHYNDLEIVKSPNDFPYLSPYWMLLETVNPNSKDKAADPLLYGETMKSIFTGNAYPQALQISVMARIRAQQDDPDRHIRKITSGKAAILKACLLRQKDNQTYREVLTVSLNEDSNNRAYVLGRLFAVLERTQTDANPGINSTIKDRYFTSACATPQNVFHALFKLYQNHLSKILKQEDGKGIGNSDNKLMTELMGKLEVEGDPFPTHLSLNDQEIFVLGYYHQVQRFYTPKAKTENNKEE